MLPSVSRTLFARNLCSFSEPVGPHSVHAGQVVYINDTELQLGTVTPSTPTDKHGRRRPIDVHLHFFAEFMDAMLEMQPTLSDLLSEDIAFDGFTAFFGGDPTAPFVEGEPFVTFGRGEGVPVVRDLDNPFGCKPYTQGYEDDAIVVTRGECTFLEKLVNAMVAGASGVVVISDSDVALNPTAEQHEIAAVGEGINEVALVVLTQSDGVLLQSLMDAADNVAGRIWLAVEPMAEDPAPESKTKKSNTDANEPARLLYINGHPLLNTRLLV